MLAYISARKKLIHIMSLSTNRPINRATVVVCVISATGNHLKLNRPETLNPLLCNIHAETRKLWTRSAVRVAASRPNPDHQSTDCPLIHAARPPRCLRHSSWLVGMQARASARVNVALTIESEAHTQFSPRSLFARGPLHASRLPSAHPSRSPPHRAQLPDRRED